MKILLVLTVLLLSHVQTYAQVPIDYVLGQNSVSKNYEIKGKSEIKIKNTSKLKILLKEDLDFTNFYTKNKDSIDKWYVSSMILFHIKGEKVITPNKITSDFELNIIANNCINTYFNQIKFCNLTGKDYFLGFYLTFDTDKNRFTFGLVEFKENNYYSIYEGSKSLHLNQNRQPPLQIIKPD
jgi:hypothetical protein